MLTHRNPAESNQCLGTELIIRIPKQKQDAAFFESRGDTNQLLNDFSFAIADIKTSRSTTFFDSSAS
jgi:hypothetical protein